MSKSWNALVLYAQVATVPTPLPELVQVEMAQAASASKSPMGDKVLSNLARRDDLVPQVRKILEASPRAACKAAWLSRPDHPTGYVEKAVATEKRVTVLAAVAGHGEASDALLEALSERNLVTVATALLDREAVPDDAALRATVTLLDAFSGLNWRQKHALSTSLASRRHLWDRLSAEATTRERATVLLADRGFEFAPEDLPRVAHLLLSDWEKRVIEVPDGSYRHGAENDVLRRAGSALLSTRGWDIDSAEDRIIADMAKWLSQYAPSRYSTMRELDDCIARHHGTPEQRDAAEKRRKDRARLLHKAATSSDGSWLTNHADTRDAAVQQALLENPHLRLEHLHRTSSPALVRACMKRGEDRIQGTGMLVALATSGDNLLDGMTDEEIAQVAAAAIASLRRGHGQAIPAWSLIRVLRDERLLHGAIPALTCAEITFLLDNDSLDAAQRSRILAATSDMLVENLVDAEQWKTFTSLISEMEGPVLESLQVASSL